MCTARFDLRNARFKKCGCVTICEACTRKLHNQKKERRICPFCRVYLKKFDVVTGMLSPERIKAAKESLEKAEKDWDEDEVVEVGGVNREPEEFEQSDSG